jgi:hypothetical protein
MQINNNLNATELIFYDMDFFEEHEYKKEKTIRQREFEYNLNKFFGDKRSQEVKKKWILNGTISKSKLGFIRRIK